MLTPVQKAVLATARNHIQIAVLLVNIELGYKWKKTERALRLLKRNGNTAWDYAHPGRQRKPRAARGVKFKRHGTFASSRSTKPRPVS